MTDSQPIPFTQYKLPDGRRVEISVHRPPDIAAKAMRIIEAGHVFECEVLTDGEVSLTITDPDKGDVDIDVCKNGPAVLDAVDKMIWRFVLP